MRKSRDRFGPGGYVTKRALLREVQIASDTVNSCGIVLSFKTLMTRSLHSTESIQINEYRDIPMRLSLILDQLEIIIMHRIKAWTGVLHESHKLP